MCSLIPSTYVYDHKTEQTHREHFRLGTDFWMADLSKGDVVFILALIYFGNCPDC